MRLSQKVIYLLFTLYFLVGLAIYRDYGISFDEHISRNYGVITYNYVTGESDELLRYQDRRQGIGVELPLYIGEKIFRLTDIQDIYYYRHLALFLLFFASTIVFYRILRSQYSSAISALGSAVLILHPRIFSNSFYNSKDIGLLCAYIFAAWGILFMLRSKTKKGAFIAGILTAWTITIRIFGFFLIPITLCVLFVDFISNRQDKKNHGKTKLLQLSALYLLSVGICTTVLWPYLWSNPLARFIETVSEMSQFHWSGTVLYFGEQIPAQHIPWHYSLVWIAITTPIAYTAAFGIGLGRSIYTLFAARKISLLNLMFVLWFFLPLGATIILKSTLYDSWRHTFFLYPALVGVAASGLHLLFNHSPRRNRMVYRVVAVAIIGLLSIRPLWFMIRYHPYQNVYFNRLVGSFAQAKQQFDLDYWGLTFRSGLEYIAKNDPAEEIPVFFAYGTVNNPNILPKEVRTRFQVVTDVQDAKYILSNYRWHPKDYMLPDWYSVTVNEVKVMSVFKVY